MRQSIDVRVYETKELIEKLEQSGANDIELTMSILKECGTFLASKSLYALAENDFAGPRGPTCVLNELFFLAFKIEDACAAVFDCPSTITTTAIKQEVGDIAERLGIKLKDEEEE